MNIEKEILKDYIEYLENYIISITNTHSRYELYVDFILEHVDFFETEGS